MVSHRISTRPPGEDGYHTRHARAKSAAARAKPMLALAAPSSEVELARAPSSEVELGRGSVKNPLHDEDLDDDVLFDEDDDDGSLGDNSDSDDDDAALAKQASFVERTLRRVPRLSTAACVTPASKLIARWCKLMLKWILPNAAVAAIVMTLMRARYSGRGAWYEALVMVIETPANCAMAMLPWYLVLRLPVGDEAEALPPSQVHRLRQAAPGAPPGSNSKAVRRQAVRRQAVRRQAVRRRRRAYDERTAARVASCRAAAGIDLVGGVRRAGRGRQRR